MLTGSRSIAFALLLAVGSAAYGETGACCMPDGTCSMMEAEDGVSLIFTCAIAGGVYLGADVPCNQCGVMTGACCLPDGSCTLGLTEEFGGGTGLLCEALFGGTWRPQAFCSACETQAEPGVTTYDVTITGDWSGIPVELRFAVEAPGAFTRTIEINEFAGVEFATTNDRYAYAIPPESIRMRAGTWEAGVDFAALTEPPTFSLSHVDYEGFKFGDAWVRVSAYVSTLPLDSGDAVDWSIYSVRSAGHYSEPWPASLDVRDLAGSWPDCTPFFEFCEWDFLQIGGAEFPMTVATVTIRARPGCPGDLDGDRKVGPDDLVTLLDAWRCPACDAGRARRPDVGAPDVADLLAAWGPCEEE